MREGNSARFRLKTAGSRRNADPAAEKTFDDAARKLCATLFGGGSLKRSHSFRN